MTTSHFNTFEMERKIGKVGEFWCVGVTETIWWWHLLANSWSTGKAVYAAINATDSNENH